MTFEIYHQLGYFYNWNLDSIHSDNTGEGVIISPRSLKNTIVENMDKEVKKKSLFDPEFFVPSDAVKKIETYGFHPSKMPGGFDTGGYISGHCSNSTSGCVDFQIKNDFRYIIIPTRYYEKIPIDQWIENQKMQFVDPFLTEAKSKRIKKPIILQIILNDQMIKDKEYSGEILNWVTGYSELDGVYLISKSTTRNQNKQIIDQNFLLSLMTFIDDLNENDMKVILGYLNTESILLSISNPSILTIGSFEKTRIFDEKNYLNEEENKGGRAPIARIYSPKLIEWIQHPFVEYLNSNFPEKMALLFGNNGYKDIMLSAKSQYKWHSMRPEPYKHSFIEETKQLKEISKIEGKNRYSYVRNILLSAIQEYTQLKNTSDVTASFIESERYGNHLPIWLSVADNYAKLHGWRK